MNIIMGGTGHIGSAVVNALIERGEPVMLMTRNALKAETLKQKGAKVVVVDLHDTARLRDVFSKGNRLFVLNPPASVQCDPDIEEIRTIDSIKNALIDSDLQHVVVLSTYGAQFGKHIGDLGTLYQLEHAVELVCTNVSIVRSAFLMSNWKSAFDEISQTGVMTSFYPEDLVMPMVAPQDVGDYCAQILLSKARSERYYVEGPKRYSIGDVKQSFSSFFGKAIKLNVIAKEHLQPAYRALGFSQAAALSYANMALANINHEIELPDNPWFGTTDLDAFIRSICPTK